jgi:hypothetical protein
MSPADLEVAEQVDAVVNDAVQFECCRVLGPLRTADPGGSKVITRNQRARYGTCSFQCRLGEICQVGSSSTAGARGSPNTS